MWFLSDFTGTNGAQNGVEGDAYGIAHEFSHHAYDLADEYVGDNDQKAECAAGPDNAQLSYCLLDNFFLRGGRSGGAKTSR